MRYRSADFSEVDHEQAAHDAAPVTSKTQARQGETSGHMRFVLLGSLFLVIVLFAVVAVVMSKF